MRRRRRLWITLLAVPLLLLAADTLYWRIATSRLQNGFAAWQNQLRHGGWTVNTQTPAVGGWPLAARLTVPALALSGGSPDIPGGVTWSAGQLVLQVMLFRPDRLEISAGGTQRLSLSGSPELVATADRLQLTLPLQPGPPGFADLSVQSLRASVPAAGESATAAAVATLRLHLDITPDAPSGQPAVEFTARAEGITPPPGARTLGTRIADAAVDGSLDGPITDARSLADRAAAWRDGGGSLQIRHLTMNWGPLDLSGSATLALDDQLQPMGAGSARIIGYAETLDALAAHGAISRSAATAAKAVLSLLAHNPEDGSPPDVEVPLTLQYRTLSMRQVPLVRLPEVDWP